MNACVGKGHPQWLLKGKGPYACISNSKYSKCLVFFMIAFWCNLSKISNILWQETHLKAWKQGKPCRKGHQILRVFKKYMDHMSFILHMKSYLSELGPHVFNIYLPSYTMGLFYLLTSRRHGWYSLLLAMVLVGSMHPIACSSWHIGTPLRMCPKWCDASSSCSP